MNEFHNTISQGFGFISDYIIRLHSALHYSIEYIQFDLNMLDGWLLYSWIYANDPLNRFGGLRMVKSPVSDEADKLLWEVKKYNGMI